MKKIDIIYSILENLEEINDDSNFSKELIAYTIDQKRNELCNKLIAGIGNITKHYIQDIDVLAIDLLDTSANPGNLTGDYILKSTTQIPIPLTLAKKEAITRVGSLDQLESSYNIVAYERFLYAGNGKYNKKQRYATYHDGYIWIKASLDFAEMVVLNKVQLSGVFEEPDKVHVLNGGADNWDYEYPIPANYISVLEGMVIQHFQPKLQFPEDPLNNATNAEKERVNQE